MSIFSLNRVSILSYLSPFDYSSYLELKTLFLPGHAHPTCSSPGEATKSQLEDHAHWWKWFLSYYVERIDSDLSAVPVVGM